MFAEAEVEGAADSMKTTDRRITIALFLTPAAVLYGVFVLFPMAQAFYLSLFDYRGLSAAKQFLGFGNYVRLASDGIFRAALWHNVVFMVVSLVVIIPAALFFAQVTCRNIPGASFYRAVYLFPNILSVVAVGILWYFIYQPSMGLLNAILGLLGAKGRPWLGESGTALPAVVATSIWYTTGFYVTLLVAGIRNIPPTFYEVAEMDGASGWQSFRHITLPLVWEILKLAIVYLVIHTLNIFGLVFVMTEGGPNRATEVTLTYLYERAFKSSEYGYATAIAAVVFVLILLLSLVSIRLLRREVVELS